MSKQDPIRILHVIGQMDEGGAETMIMSLYRCIDRERIQFDFVEHFYKEASFDREIESLGGRIYRCPRFKGYNYREYMHWWKEFYDTYSKEYAIVHGHIGSTASIYLNEAKKKALFTIAHSHNTKGNRTVKNTLYQIISRNTRNIADDFFACSMEAGTDRFGAAVVSTDRFHVLNNAIDTTRFVFDREKRYRVRRELSLNGKRVIGHVGAFRTQKNHSFLMDVFNIIVEKDKDCVLLLVGDGPLRKQIEKISTEYGITDKVRFLGVRNDVSDILQAMDIMVMPSLYEGLGIALVEAQATGLPCVISDTIPGEGIIVKDLVTAKSLDDDPGEWAEHVLTRLTLPENTGDAEEEKSGSNVIRKSRTDEIVEAGYDIRTTAKWLESYYISHAEQ